MSRGCNWIEFERPAKIASLFLLTLFFHLVDVREARVVVILGKNGSLLRRVEEFRFAVLQEGRR